jgi:hypothetical protein
MAESTDSTRDIVMRMDGKLDAVLKMVQQHDCDLNGNGKPGLKSDMRSIQKDVSDMKKKRAEVGVRSWQVLMLAIGEGISLIGLGLAFALKLK